LMTDITINTKRRRQVMILRDSILWYFRRTTVVHHIDHVLLR
jgi:hypothetical protein